MGLPGVGTALSGIGGALPGVRIALSLVATALLLVVVAFCVAAPTPARAGVAFGLRGGYADVDGKAFLGSGKIGGTPLVGLQAILPIVPLVSLVIAGEQRTRSFDFGNAAIGDLRLRGRAKWTDQALYAAARVRVPGAVGLYGGAGAGMHRQKTDLSGVVELAGVPKAGTRPSARVVGPRRVGSAAAGNPLDDFVNRAEKEATDLSWHAFAGLEFSTPALPVAIFAEGRIDDIQGSDPRSLAAYAGFNLKLP
jgi:hypothetical protein